MEKLTEILATVFESLLHIWPYLLITIPFSVIIKLTDVNKYINRVLGKRVFLSIILATAVGAFSPLCSCSVIPVIASLLIGGVPLAPVMSFWIASPSMDPEIFFLSVSVLGWDISMWRLGATLVMSLMAGFITHLLVKKGILGDSYIKAIKPSYSFSLFDYVYRKFSLLFQNFQLASIPVSTTTSCVENATCSSKCDVPVQKSSCGCDSKSEEPAVTPVRKEPFYKTVILESYKSTIMVVKFMALAYLINALIMTFLPGDLLSNSIASNNAFSIIVASLVGIPAYTSNITAIPLISGLLEMGMSPAAALSFLIAGPVTTIPAMVAVHGITSKRVFILYLLIGLLGSIISGYMFMLFV